MNLDDRFHGWSRDTPFQRVAGRGDGTGDIGLERGLRVKLGRVACAHRGKKQTCLDIDERHKRSRKRALDALVYCGETASVKVASNWLWQDGPVEALADVVNEWATAWPLRSERTVFGLFAEAADLLDTTRGNKLVHRLIDTLRTEPRVRTFAGAADRRSEIPRALERALTAAGTRAHRRAARLVADHLLPADDSYAQALDRVLRVINLNNVNALTLADLVAAATARTDGYGTMALETLAPHAETAVNELRRRSDAHDVLATRVLVAQGLADPGHWATVGREAASSRADHAGRGNTVRKRPAELLDVFD